MGGSAGGAGDVVDVVDVGSVGSAVGTVGEVGASDEIGEIHATGKSSGFSMQPGTGKRRVHHAMPSNAAPRARTATAGDARRPARPTRPAR
ncbi:hypothetical protein [Burkholderia pseudomallei]|uniref:hypothetical protein n=1 Tax=Burkholderia pseudomallei TaxID=28450 RepID=UPI0009777F19|nr:hypothetical protein [Burkholderia pseudomallei]MCV9913587.1 hypothetical protein [Burkholderia pseudomallei]MCV9972112.1 hypothetical protein [Burkholderia pseudomallei]MCW0072318.1 hypothetical protein [Burkholderia pseudomallei]MDV2125101.1 hypothetical protein [Burkholderia pseudomallei]MDV2229431.1 hypothetical protein [Burkholderia pseudomallei]